MDTSESFEYRRLRKQRVQAFGQPFLGRFCGGPVLLDFRDAALRHKRADNPVDSFVKDAEYPNHLDGSWIYLGPKYHHFGHILAEMIHRIVPSKCYFPEQKFLIVTTGDDMSPPNFASLAAPYRAVLEFCEILPKHVVVINSNAIVDELCICEQGSNLLGKPKYDYLKFFEVFSNRRLDELCGTKQAGGKVYISRSNILHGGNFLGERFLEECLADDGYSIFHPEDHAFAKQMDVYRKADVLIFPEGSACHGTELLGHNALSNTAVLLRRQNARPAYDNLLRRRSKNFSLFRESYFLGTIVQDPTSEKPLPEFGVSLLDIRRLVLFLQAAGLAGLSSVNYDDYYDSAKQDLQRYFTYHTECGTSLVDPWQIGEIRARFDRACQVLRGEIVGLTKTPRTREPTLFAPSQSASEIEAAAWVAQSEKNWATAKVCWEAFRERFPDDPAGYALGGLALIELKQFTSADRLLQAGMELFPSHAELRGNFGWSAHHSGDWLEAILRWEKYREHFPQEVVGYSIGATALLELKQYAAADTLIKSGVAAIGEHPELLEKSAWIAHIQEDWAEAKARWSAFHSRFPENPTARRMSADI